MQALYGYEINGTAAEPLLAEVCEPNDDLTVWTCTLRQGVTFHDGSAFDANDVVMSFTVGLDASSPYHVGNTGVFELLRLPLGSDERGQLRAALPVPVGVQVGHLPACTPK